MMNTGAVLVAAGMSSRMKDFKPMLPFGKTTISRHMVDMMTKCDLSPIVVVTGYRAADLEEHLSHTGVRFMENVRYAQTQMFDSVILGIKNVINECDRVLIMPVDIPAIQLETIQLALQCEEEMIRTLYHGKPGHPIILYKEVARKLCNYKGEGGLRGAMEHSGIPITNLEVEDRGVCWDADTKEEYQEMIEWTRCHKTFTENKGTGDSK